MRSRLAPFRHQSFRRFFMAQTLSLVGTWSTDLARAWIVIELMKNASSLGLIMMTTALPALFLTLHAGVIVDRVNVRVLMVITKALMAVLALFLTWATEWNYITFPLLLALALFEGAITAFDMPAYQAMAVRLVPRADLQQALAINSTNFHMARMLGPLVAGLLMAWHGPSLVFLFDAISYFILVFLISSIELREIATEKLKGGTWKSLTDGLSYLWNLEPVRYKMLQLTLTWFTIMPMMFVVFRTFLQAKFNLSSEQFGYLFTLPATGSVTGALSFAALQPKRPIRALVVGVPGVVVMTLLVPHLDTALSSAIAMAFVGFFLYLNFASLTVSIQLEIADAFRGRVSSAVALGFVALGPLAGLPIGLLADRLGSEPTIWILATLFGLGSLALAIFHHRQTPIERAA